ncbi:MAG TPA: membrane protein insertion efficiency factor YidD [Peptococcaceae bacterium]|nr:membrane protein insertion efficiency factor YidD [Peptococcaceae bacterium]
MVERIANFLEKLLIGLIRFYQKFISPLKPRTCRFYPTCSEYALQAIKKYGILQGTGKAIIRILKCNPFHPGGYDPV